METFVILLIMAAISLFNWLMRKSAEAREAQERAQREQEGEESAPSYSRPSHKATPPVGRKSEEDRLREFMEALGIPKDKLPRQLRREEPPPVPRPPERKPAPATPPPLRRAAQQTRKKRKPSVVVVETPAQAPTTVQTTPTPFPTEPEISETIEVGTLTPPQIASDAYKVKTAADRAASRPAVALREALHSPDSFRTAYLMHEILSQPRSLRAESDLPGLARSR
jgi:hypothetical protein